MSRSFGQLCMNFELREECSFQETIPMLEDMR